MGSDLELVAEAKGNQDMLGIIVNKIVSNNGVAPKPWAPTAKNSTIWNILNVLGPRVWNLLAASFLPPKLGRCVCYPL